MQLAERHIIKSTEHRFAPSDQLAFQSKRSFAIVKRRVKLAAVCL
jgi:hypothetical protein